VTVRAATAGHLDAILDFAAAQRDDQATHQPVFWRPATDARNRQRPFLAGQIDDDQVITLVATDPHVVVGFAVGVPHPVPPVYDRGEPTCTVDDVTVDHPARWPTTGAALLRQLRSRVTERVAAQVVIVVCGHHDHPKRARAHRRRTDHRFPVVDRRSRPGSAASSDPSVLTVCTVRPVTRSYPGYRLASAGVDGRLL